MNIVLSVYKPIGLTPLQLISRLKEEYPQYKNEKIGYAGRLDPMAHGVTLLMIGEATKEREKFLTLPKEYEFEALLGVVTDTYDVLGLIWQHNLPQITKDETSNVNLIVNSFASQKIGKILVPYPPYSSKTVHGKPLFWWARENKLAEITIPEREIKIYSFEFVTLGTISKSTLKEKIFSHIAMVQGDFRQKETLDKWNSFFETQNQTNRFQTAKFRIRCSSGTYVRGLVNELGKTLGCGAIALDILRTKVGEYSLSEAIKLPF